MHRINGDVSLWAECKAQWDMLSSSSQLDKIFKTGQPIKSITGFNKHEKIMKAQEGGTDIVVHDHMANICSQSGTDSTRLGRWYWFNIEGKYGLNTK